MSDTPFAIRAAQTLDEVLDRLSQNEALSDLDFDLIDGVLKIEFDDGGVLILNRQEAAGQLWLASPEGPAHFSYDAGAGAWLDDKDGGELFATLSRILSRQTGSAISL